MVLTLYGINMSPPYRAVLMTANILDLQFDEKVIDLKNGDHLTPEYLKINPQHTVPTLTDGEFAVWDSHAIIPYLVEKYGKGDSLYPKDLQQRAIIDQRLHFDSGLLFNRMRAIVYPMIANGVKEIPEDKLKEVLEAYGFLEAFLERSTWIAGEKMTIADISLIATVCSSDVVVPVKGEKFPKLKAWYDKCKCLPFYKEANVKGLGLFRDMLQKIMA